jgi:hypothetical protein
VTLHLADSPATPAERLERLLTDNHADGTSPSTVACERPGSGRDVRGLVPQDDGWFCDPAWDMHGLTWWYPQVVDLLNVRSTGGRRGAGGAIAVPIDLGALDFVSGRYWAADETPTERTLDDPDSYRLGFVPTVIALEQSARRALRLEPRPRRKAEGYDGLGVDARIPAALAWLAVHAQQLFDEAPLYARTVRQEALRLLGRSAAMVLGNRFTASVNECMHCAQLTVIADEDRAVCRNPECRRPDGTRYCWQLRPDAETGAPAWTEVDEPDVRGRGRLTEEQMSRWTDTG